MTADTSSRVSVSPAMRNKLIRTVLGCLYDTDPEVRRIIDNLDEGDSDLFTSLHDTKNPSMVMLDHQEMTTDDMETLLLDRTINQECPHEDLYNNIDADYVRDAFSKGSDL